MTRYLTWLSLKSLNRSLKSELTNIAALDPIGVSNEFPCGCKARWGRLRLPEVEIERPIQFGEFAMFFAEICSHGLRLVADASGCFFRMILNSTATWSVGLTTDPSRGTPSAAATCWAVSGGL